MIVLHDQIKLYFNKGERRKIQLDVYSCKNEPFIILHASYSVVDHKGQIVTSGNCIITDKTLSLMYDASNRGLFTITITLIIADEIIKEKVVVCVS